MTDRSAIDAASPAWALQDAAMALLIQHGIHGLDFHLIDMEAGVPPGTCGRRYGTRGKLVADLLESSATRFHSDLRTIFQRHPGDPVAAVVEWLALVLGPARDEMRAIWSLLLDAGVRSQVAMYADALGAGWERQIAAGLGCTLEEVRIVWPMIEGWAGCMIIRGRPMPEHDVVAAHVRTLLPGNPAAHAPPKTAPPPVPVNPQNEPKPHATTATTATGAAAGGERRGIQDRAAPV